MITKRLIVVMLLFTDVIMKAKGSEQEGDSLESAMVCMVNVFHGTTSEPGHITCERDPTHWTFLTTAVTGLVIMTAITLIMNCVTTTILYRKDHKVV